jgi:hypothetical protein
VSLQEPRNLETAGVEKGGGDCWLVHSGSMHALHNRTGSNPVFMYSSIKRMSMTVLGGGQLWVGLQGG